MAGKTVVRCPGCESQLALGMSQQELAGRKIRCPKCERTFTVKGSSSAKPPASKQSTAARTKPSSTAAQTAKAKPSTKPRSAAASASKVSKTDPRSTQAGTSKAGGRKSAPSASAPAKKKTRKKKRVEPEPLEFLEEYDDDDAEFFDDGSTSGGYDDDLYGDDAYGNDPYGDDGFDDYADDDYGAPPPSRKKKKKSSSKSKTKAKSKPKSELGESPNHGFLGWAGYGLGAAALCTLVTTLVGMTGIWFLVVIMAIVTGSVVGGAVRYAAGYNLGWGPGLVAAVLAFGSILTGRVVVIAMDPNSIANFADRHSPESIAAEIEKHSSEEAMISQIGDQVEEDAAWLQENGISESMIEEHREEFDYDGPFEDHHLPQIWEEAKRRWNEKPADERQKLIEQERRDLRMEFGVMSKEEVEQLIVTETTDESMIAHIAEVEVTYDDDWRQKSGITDQQIEAHWDSIDYDSAEPQQRHLPAVWEEATTRWDALSDPEKETKKQERASDLRIENGVDEEANAQASQAIGILKWLLLFGSAIGTMVLPLWPLFCTGSGLTAAFKLGSGMASS